MGEVGGEPLLFCAIRGQLRGFASDQDALWTPPFRGQTTPEGLYLSSGLGTLQEELENVWNTFLSLVPRIGGWKWKNAWMSNPEWFKGQPPQGRPFIQLQMLSPS